MSARHALLTLALLAVPASRAGAQQAVMEVTAQVVATPPLRAAVLGAPTPVVVRRAGNRADVVAPVALGMSAARRTLTIDRAEALPAGVRVLVDTPEGTRALDGTCALQLEIAGGDATQAELRFHLVGPGVREGVRVPVALTLVAQDADATGEARWSVVLAP